MINDKGGMSTVPGTRPIGSSRNFLDPKQAPLQAGDWLTVITPMINDLAPAANEYWGSVLQAAECVYERWQSASPLLKAQVQANLPDHMRHARYSVSRIARFPCSFVVCRMPCEKKSLLPETCALSTLCSKSLLHTNRVG